LFAVAFYAQTYAEKKSYAGFILALVVYVASIVFISRYQQKVVDFYKIMNPEKQGSVYDVKFQKKWIESCDEAERQAIYRCGFKAYRTASLACVLLWMLFVLMALFLQISLWPVTVTTIFWLILTVSYLWEAHKIGKKGRSETIL
jgi:peptidoglycan biosynthesis protein MviN/MurJ (putative lipid II flippase)